MEHESEKGEPVETGEGSWQPLVVTCQASEAADPGEGAFDHPASWQQDKTSLGFLEFDHDQANALCCGSRGWLCSGVSLIGESHLDVAIGHRLHLLRQSGDLSPLLFIGGRHLHGEQMTERVDGNMDLRSLLALVEAIPKPPC